MASRIVTGPRTLQREVTSISSVVMGQVVSAFLLAEFIGYFGYRVIGYSRYN